MDEIERIRRQEERRGKRPVDSETVAEKKRKLVALRTIWENGTAEDLERAMRLYGVVPGSVEWNAALQVWRGGREPR